MKAMDIKAGDVFSWLTVIDRAENYVTPSGKKHSAIRCVCRCGAERVVLAASLKRGATKSCGCYGRSKELRAKHGHGMRNARSGEYTSWAQMRNRCACPTANGYENYGGRGIKVCERWSSFENFLADMGPRPPGYSIERKDTNGNYEPNNCRWASGEDQRNNTRRSRLLTFNGETRTVKQWADATGLSQSCITARLRRGWKVERALA